jgi:hypothetical protein
LSRLVAQSLIILLSCIRLTKGECKAKIFLRNVSFRGMLRS